MIQLVNKTPQYSKIRRFMELEVGDAFLWVNRDGIIMQEEIWIKTNEYLLGGVNTKGQKGMFCEKDMVILLVNCQLHYELERE